mgnify:CR=1 FL=1
MIVKGVESRPRQEEVDERNVNHIPFRSWCAHCFKGKANNQGHSSSASGSHESEVAVVSKTMHSLTQMERTERGEKKERREGKREMKVKGEACR